MGWRVGEIALAPYAAVETVRRHPGRSLAQHDWVGWVPSWGAVPMERWLAEHVPPERVRCRVDDIAVLRAAVLAGVGVGHLLCLSGDPDVRLRRVGAPLEGHGLSLWVLTHPDLRRTARVRALLGHVADGMRRERDLLEGRVEVHARERE